MKAATEAPTASNVIEAAAVLRRLEALNVAGVACAGVGLGLVVGVVSVLHYRPEWAALVPATLAGLAVLGGVLALGGFALMAYTMGAARALDRLLIFGGAS